MTDPAPNESSELTPTTPRPDPAVVPASALEPMANVLRAQVELLARMEQRQQDLERSVRDEKRHEVQIRSAEALNESFNGMRRVQEALAQRLEEAESPSRRRWMFAAIVLLALAVVGAAVWLREGVEPLRALADRKSSDEALTAAIAKLEGRVGGVEERDRDSFRKELDDLRTSLDALRDERDGARRERDDLRSRFEAAAKEFDALRAELATATSKVATLEKDNGRLAAETAADKRLLSELGRVIESLKTTTRPAPIPASGDVAASAKEAPAPVAAVPFASESLDKLNDLLRRHRGSDRYVLTRAERVEGRRLRGVTLEVRGADGSVSRTIDADSLAVWLAARGDLLELEFERGGVVFRLGASAKPVKSPFFNDRYQIVVLGVDGKAWIDAGFTFVGAR